MSATADFVVPSRALQRYILADEKIIVATHRHWAKIWEPILTTFGAFVLALALLMAVDPNVRDDMAWAWIPFLVLGARLAYKWLDWRAEWFVLTDRRLLLLDGFLVHRVAMMPSEKVTDLGYERTPLGQILGYGTFIFETAGQDQALDRVTWVPRPDARYRLIIATLFHPDAADAEAAAQTAQDGRVHVVPPAAESPAPAPPPALMPRIGRRSNPPTQRIELPIARGNSATEGTGGTPADDAAQPATSEPAPNAGLPGRGPGTGAPQAGTSGSGAGADGAGGTAASGTGTHRTGAQPTRDGDAGHVPGGPTAAVDDPERRPKPFIEGGDPKFR